MTDRDSGRRVVNTLFGVEGFGGVSRMTVFRVRGDACLGEAYTPP